MRINRHLADCGLGSRRACEDLVRAGRVRINGVVVCALATSVFPGARVEVDGQVVTMPETGRVILFHKPRGILCTRSDPEGRTTLYDILPHALHRLDHAGRLDADSRGLLILTDDGELLHRITHPRYDHPKRYRVVLDAPLPEAAVARFRTGGTMLSGERRPLRPVEVHGDGVVVELVLREGRHRQIRRMAGMVGREVLDLMRVAHGPWELAELAEGCWKESTIRPSAARKH